MNRRITAQNATTIGAFCVATALFLFALIYQPSFGSSNSLSQVAIFAAFMGIAALGQTLVVLGGGMDLSVPWTIALGGVAFTQWSSSGIPPGVALALVIVAGVAVGAVNGIGVSYLKVSPIVMTLGVGGIVQAYLLHVGLGSGTGDAAPNLAQSIATGSVAGIPTLAIFWLVLAVGASLVLSKSAFGRRLYALGMNERGAYLAGVRVNQVRILTYMASGVASVLAGVVLSGYLGEAFVDMGGPYLFGSIAAVAVGGASILGGQGSYWGTVAGALTLTFLSSVLSMFDLGQSALQIAYGLVIIGGVLFGRVAAGMARSGSRLRRRA